MGFGIKELIIILVIVVLLFGTKKLKGLGSDLGSAIKGFRKSMGDEGAAEDEKKPEQLAAGEEHKQADAEASKPKDKAQS